MALFSKDHPAYIYPIRSHGPGPYYNDYSRLEFHIIHDEGNVSMITHDTRHSSVPLHSSEIRVVWQVQKGYEGYTVYDEAGKVVIRNLQAKGDQDAHGKAYDLAMSLLPLLCREIEMKACIKDQDAFIEDLEADIRDLEGGDV